MIEDIFAENLVDDPDDIERVIEDGEDFRRDSDGGSDDEDKKKDQEEKEKEKPKVRKTMGPRPVLNAQRLKGPRGIATMEKFFSGIQLDGRRGKEAKDLDVIMKRLELWTHRLYPRGQFDDCLKKIEKLGTKKIVRNYITRIRLGMEDGSGESDVIREEPNSPPPVASTSHDDPFDQLISSTIGPEVTSRSNTEMTTEQRERMLMNRLIAEERRAARIRKAQELKERFRAQQTLSSQSVSGGGSSCEPRRSDTQDHWLENSDGALEMEVDENQVSSGMNINQRDSEDGGSNEKEKVSNRKEIQGNETSETFNLLNNIDDPIENLETKLVQECSTLEEEEMLDGVDPKVCKTQENSNHISEEHIGQSNQIKQNENKTIEEMDICEVSTTMGSLSTENHIISKEEIPLKDKEDIESLSKIKGKERRILKDQEGSGDQADSLEKENENPNPD